MMALNPKDPETDRLTRALATEIDEIVQEFAKLPVLDPRTPDDIIGYDETGMWT